jgi:membrane fusion protein, epimerase transport system
LDDNLETSSPLSTRQHARRVAGAGLLIVLLALLPLFAWIAFAPLSMAVVAPGFVKIDLNRRPVQHLEGGIVRTVLVRDGQTVNAGDPILLLGDVSVDAERNRLEYRLNIERAGLARLESEQMRADVVVFPSELQRAANNDDRIRQALSKETALFDSRRNSLASEIALLREQRLRIEKEMTALEAQIERMQSAHALQHDDLATNRKLLASGFISPNRVTQIEAGVTDYAGKLEERRSELARATQRLGDVDLKVQSMQNAYVHAASDQLKVTAARIGEIEQEMRKSDDAAARQVVVAPASGAVIELKVTSPGAVVRPGDSIAEIVPQDAVLMVEAHIRPEEISNVQLDQRARIKFSAFKYRNDTMVTGTVSYVSADRLVDRANNLPYFSVMIIADPDSLRSVGEFNLQAGMPAEVYIEGSKQTPLQYLMEPIMSTVRKAGRQM